MIKWPETREDYLKLGEAVTELVCGRKDVAARYYDFTKPDPDDPEKKQRFKGWTPWKGQKVKSDYKAAEGELVHPFKNHNQGGIEHRILKPLTPETYINHLRGKDRLGVYVLDPEMKVKFLAADFDDHEGTLEPAAVWDEVQKFVDTCETHDWIVHIEKSKSGTGYHVWLFFDEPVPADKVRAIGRWLFEESQTLREDDDFSTFDRFFPAQAALPVNGKGFGNLIALPMFGFTEYEEGKAAWIDKEQKIIADPMAYTLSIVNDGRNPASQVDLFMEEWGLSAEEVNVYEGKARDPNQSLGNQAEFDAMFERCKFLQYASKPENQSLLNEPQWFDLVSNACRFDVDDWIHEASCEHKGYSPVETSIKIDHCRTSAGPHTCATIQNNGFKGCPSGGCKLPNKNTAKSPAGLSAWSHTGENKNRNRTVNVKPPQATEQDNSNFAPPFKDDIPVYEETGMPWPYVPNWDIDNGGVKDHQGQSICMRPLWVDAVTRNNIGLYGVSLKFFDLDWNLKTCAIPRERLHEQGGILGRELASQGLPIVPGKEKWVSRFIVVSEMYSSKRIRSAGRLGWFDAPQSPAIFVLPSQVLGKAPEEIVYQPDVALHTSDTLHGQGKLKQWQDHVATPTKGNPMLMFSLLLGLGGPLLKLCQEQSGGFHLYGVTTGGKTTAAQVAASVWGCAADPQEGPEVTSIRKWYTTGNALESIAEVHNDTLLTLDEIGEVDPHELGRIIYQLAGGLSKGRANAGGGLRNMRTWRMLFFSTGEKSVRQMLAQAGQAQKGGQRVRLPDIPADDNNTGARAIIVDSHNRDPKDFVQDLKLACASYYGLAGPVFVSYLIAKAETLGMSKFSGELKEQLRALEDIMRKDYNTQEMIALPPEGVRVLRRFALVALAGALANKAGIIDWELTEIISAVVQVRDRWLSDQGQERSEMDRALSHFRDQLMRNAGRFLPYDRAPNQGQRDLLGFRVDDYFLLMKESMDELAGEHDSRTLLNHLKTEGFLWHDKDRLTRKAPKTEYFGNSRPNLYWISIDFIGVKQTNNTEEDVKAGAASQEDLDLVSGETRGAWEDDNRPPF